MFERYRCCLWFNDFSNKFWNRSNSVVFWFLIFIYFARLFSYMLIISVDVCWPIWSWKNWREITEDWNGACFIFTDFGGRLENLIVMQCTTKYRWREISFANIYEKKVETVMVNNSNNINKTNNHLSPQSITWRKKSKKTKKQKNKKNNEKQTTANVVGNPGHGLNVSIATIHAIKCAVIRLVLTV